MSLESRRRFLRFIASSPLLTLPLAGRTMPGIEPTDLLAMEAIDDAADALDVFDMQRVAAAKLPPAHYGYLETGTDGNETLRANREAIERLYLRAMRMVDTRNIDTRTSLLGQELGSPIILAPVGSQRAFHPEGEVASARAARTRNHLQILSNVTSRSIEDVIDARGEPVWQQLYPTSRWSATERILERAEQAGARVIVLTIDLNANSNRVMLQRFMRMDDRDCSACHGDGPDDWLTGRPFYSDLGLASADFPTPGMTWEFVEKLKSATRMKVVVKGIVTAEDAADCVRHGADAVYVSNHGGRAEASGWGAIDSLPEVVDAVGGRVPVLVDSGFRRGTDVFKALALGADAVCIGRAYVYGLAAFGQPGVEKVLDLLNAELRMVMAQMGTPTLADIGERHIGRHGTADS